MCTTSFHPTLASAPKFQIRYAHSISPDCYQLYIVIVANGCGYTQGPFWLPWRIALVGQENQIEATQNLPDIHFLNIRFLILSFLPMPPPKRKYNTVSAISDKFSNIIRVETSRYLTKIMTLRKADREGSCSQAYGFATITMYSWWQPKRDWMPVPNLKFWSPRQRGG